MKNEDKKGYKSASWRRNATYTYELAASVEHAVGNRQRNTKN